MEIMKSELFWFISLYGDDTYKSFRRIVTSTGDRPLTMTEEIINEFCKMYTEAENGDEA